MVWFHYLSIGFHFNLKPYETFLKPYHYYQHTSEKTVEAQGFDGFSFCVWKGERRPFCFLSLITAQAVFLCEKMHNRTLTLPRPYAMIDRRPVV